jgi:hypothetical protein
MEQLSRRLRDKRRQLMDRSFKPAGSFEAPIQFSIEEAQRELATHAAQLRVDPVCWACVIEMWATTGLGNRDTLLPGYGGSHQMTRKHFATLQDHEMLRDDVMTQAGIRMVAYTSALQRQHAVFYTSMALELLAPFQLGGDGSPSGQKLRRQ